MESINFELGFLKAFSNLENSDSGLMTINNCPCFYYTRHIFEFNLVDLSVIPFNNRSINIDNNNCKELFDRFDFLDTITIYNINFFGSHDRKYIFENYYKYICVISEFHNPLNRVKNKKNLNKFLKIDITNNIDDFYAILSLGNKKVVTMDSANIIQRQAKYLFEKKDEIISMNVKSNNKLVAGMICKKNSNELEMICCNYNNDFLQYSINDILYYSTIEWCKKNGIIKVDWGNVSEYDTGLMRFKKKYSTNILKFNLCHVFKRGVFI